MINGVFFFFQAEDGIRDKLVTGVQTCALPISAAAAAAGKGPQPQTQTVAEKAGGGTPGPRQRRPEREKPRTSGQPRTEVRERRERAPDPNSPFAKLAALKAQLEAASKERP